MYNFLVLQSLESLKCQDFTWKPNSGKGTSAQQLLSCVLPPSKPRESNFWKSRETETQRHREGKKCLRKKRPNYSQCLLMPIGLIFKPLSSYWHWRLAFSLKAKWLGATFCTNFALRGLRICAFPKGLDLAFRRIQKRKFLDEFSRHSFMAYLQRKL